MLGISFWDWVAIFIYFAVTVVAGIWTVRKVKDTTDYFMAGRRFGKPFMIFFAFGAGTSGNDAVGVSSKTFTAGMSGIWYQWLWLFCTPFYWLIAPIMRRMRCLTTGDFFEYRYDSSVSALYTLVGVGQLTVNIGVIQLGAGSMIEGLTEGAVTRQQAIVAMTVMFVIYGIAGGLAAAIVTDFIQGILTVILSFILLPFALDAVGGRLISGDRSGLLIVRDLETLETQLEFPAHDGSVEGIAVGPEGRRVATASRDGSVRIHDLGTGETTRIHEAHEGNVRDVAFDPRGELVASAAWDRTVALLPLGSVAPPALLRGHRDHVERVCFTPGGERIVTFSRDGTIRFWTRSPRAVLPELTGHADAVADVAFGPGTLATAGGEYERLARTWDPESLGMRERIPLSGKGAGRVAVSPEGRWIATTGVSDELRVQPAGAAGTHVALPGRFMDMEFSDDGRLLFGADRDRGFVVYETRGWRARGGVPIPDALTIAPIPGTDRVALGTVAGEVVLLRVSPPRVLTRRDVSRERIHALASAPDASLLAAGADGGRILLLDAGDLCTGRILRGHAGAVLSLCFTPDGGRLASGSDDGTLRIWDPAHGEQVLLLGDRGHPILAVRFSADGRWLASGEGLPDEPGTVTLRDGR